MNTSDRGFSGPFKGAGAVANGLMEIRNVFMECLFVFNWAVNALGQGGGTNRTRAQNGTLH
jgi:hypothetical protein